MTGEHGGSAGWRWEAYGPDGVCRIEDVLPSVWWPLTASEAADLAMARLMVRVQPDYKRLAGWRVRAWRGGEDAWASADEWLRIDAKGPPRRRQAETASPG